MIKNIIIAIAVSLLLSCDRDADRFTSNTRYSEMIYEIHYNDGTIEVADHVIHPIKNKFVYRKNGNKVMAPYHNVKKVIRRKGSKQWKK